MQQLDSLWHFFLPDDPRSHGFLVDSVVQVMPWTPDFRLVTSPRKEVHLVKPDVENWQRSCNEAIDNLLHLAREKGIFPRLRRKHEEYFPILGANFAISIDRSAFTLFGIIGRGAHMTVYTHTASGFKFWVPERNHVKSTYPGLLDNTVAGGIPAGESPFECLIREAAEEADLPEELVRRDARAVGSVSWFNISDDRAGGEAGLMNPGVLYVYDLKVDEDMVLKPVDDDIHAFHLFDTNQVMSKLALGSFKPSCAVVMIDFFVRHGIITAENETEYAEIISRLHRKLPFPMTPA